MRLRIGGAEVAVSGEETGWHVVIRGTVPPPGAAALITALAGRISAAAGHDVKVTEL